MGAVVFVLSCLSWILLLRPFEVGFAACAMECLHCCGLLCLLCSWCTRDGILGVSESSRATYQPLLPHTMK